MNEKLKEFLKTGKGKLTVACGALLISWIFPIVLIIVIGQFISRKMAKSMGGGPGAMMFGKSNAKVYVKSSTGIKFSDVAGKMRPRSF